MLWLDLAGGCGFGTERRSRDREQEEVRGRAPSGSDKVENGNCDGYTYA